MMNGWPDARAQVAHLCENPSRSLIWYSRPSKTQRRPPRSPKASPIGPRGLELRRGLGLGPYALDFELGRAIVFREHSRDGVKPIAPEILSSCPAVESV